MQVNRNSQTTSTKCQYQAAASNPKCRSGVKWPARARNQQTIRKQVPTITWKPWKPVARKKVEGYTPPPTNLNGASEYSIAWHRVKLMPSRIVRPSPTTSVLLSRSSRPWCAQVIVVPDNSRIMVLRNGTWNGSKVWMVDGGHTVWPLPCTSGNSAKLKNAQKKPTKNITSDEMKNSIP